jgi:hypothetical protein
MLTFNPLDEFKTYAKNEITKPQTNEMHHTPSYYDAIKEQQTALSKLHSISNQRYGTAQQSKRVNDSYETPA